MTEARAPHANELGILVEVLSARPFGGAAELLAQLDRLTVIPQPLPTWLYFRVDPLAPLAPTPDGPIPTRAVVHDTSGVAIGFIIIWVEGGRLSAMEFAWVSDEMPANFPQPEQVVVEPVSDGSGSA